MQAERENFINSLFDDVYNRYSPMLYSIALEISPTEKDAEEILIATFIKIHKQKLHDRHHPSLCVILIKLIMQTAQEMLKQKEQIRLKLFVNTPMLHQIICGCISMEEICSQNKLKREDVAKIIREEIRGLFKITEKETVSHLYST